MPADLPPVPTIAAECGVTTDLRPDQKLIYVREASGYRQPATPEEVTITRVGRKWAYLSWKGYRVDRGTLIVDGAGYSSPGRCYLSLEHYHAEQVADKAWQRLVYRLEYKNRGAGVTAEAIHQAAALLGVSIDG